MSDRAHLTVPRYHLSSLLGYLGVLPFVLLTGLIVNGHFSGQGVQSASLFGLQVFSMFTAYSAVILSFLSGALWERSRLAESKGLTASVTTSLILFSNVIALTSWVCLLLISVAPIMTLVALCLLMAGFLSLLWVEHSSGKTRLTSNGSYGAMRLRITITVVLLHALIAALMLTEL
ncbi:MAG: hypothetical protein ACJAWL_003151 [Motiliproteus sp.]|jgi:hypothetical protein